MLSVANESIMLSVANKSIMLSVIMLNVVMLSVVILNVVARVTELDRNEVKTVRFGNDEFEFWANLSTPSHRNLI
jgi:hypothetical protein